MGSLFIHVDSKGCPPLGPRPDTPMPLDHDDWDLALAIGTLSMALCTVCARKEVINLLNHTPLTGRLVAARNKYGGYRNKTRSMVDSGGSKFPAIISTT